MSSKLMIAAAVLASAALLQPEPANAQRRDGAERAGNAAAQAGRPGRQGRRAGQNRNSNAANTATRGERRNATRSTPAPRQATRNRGRDVPVRAARARDRNPGWRNWGNRVAAWRPWRRGYRAVDNGCRAVARTRGGNGKRIYGISGEGFGRRACRKAMRRCNIKLDRRQAYGRNPYAACVVASRY